jgi:hypothetical protein
LLWRVTYCAAEARHQFSTLTLTTFDGAGLGSNVVYPPDANGIQLVNCRPYKPGVGFIDTVNKPNSK